MNTVLCSSLRASLTAAGGSHALQERHNARRTWRLSSPVTFARFFAQSNVCRRVPNSVLSIEKSVSDAQVMSTPAISAKEPLPACESAYA